MGERGKKAGARPDQVVTSLRLSRDAHERARILGIKTQRSLQSIVDEALAEYLKKRNA